MPRDLLDMPEMGSLDMLEMNYKLRMSCENICRRVFRKSLIYCQLYAYSEPLVPGQLKFPKAASGR